MTRAPTNDVADLVCVACGTMHYDQAAPPSHCPVCEDERQYVPPEGQKWISARELGAKHRVMLKDDDGMPGIGLDPAFGINQRAILVRGEHRTILWECLGLVTDEIAEELTNAGPIDCIAISHPHFYGAMQRWSEALGNVPIHIHENDRGWVPAAARNVEFWNGDLLHIAPGLTLLRCGGHFPGSTALHWRDNANPDGALMPGDALQVSNNRQHVSFMYSYPNAIPMPPHDVMHIRDMINAVEFERVYGYTWRRNLVSDGKLRVLASFDRFFDMTEHPELRTA